MKLSIVIPAYNEEANLGPCLDDLRRVVAAERRIPCEILVVDDNSRDGTADVVRDRMREDPCLRLIQRRPPSGFGRAVRAGLARAEGDVVVVYMADRSDDPADVVAYYRKIEEGYDCVFGSRFIRGSVVEKYPWRKLVCNRIVNRVIQVMFWTRFNDLTNAFKAYRTSVIRDCGPYRSSHFNITLEMSLGALIRRYSVAQIPIRWYGRTWGSSKLRLREMGRRYLCTLLMLYFQRTLISDDLMAERLAGDAENRRHLSDLEARLAGLEEKLGKLEGRGAGDARSEPPSEAAPPDRQPRGPADGEARPSSTQGD